MKGKCVWPKPSRSPQPPASALRTIGCGPAARPVCTWSAPGSRRYVIKEHNSLGNHFLLWGSSPWASPWLQCVRCVLLHRELTGCFLPVKSSRYGALGEGLHTLHQHCLLQPLLHLLTVHSLPSPVCPAVFSVQGRNVGTCTAEVFVRTVAQNK